MRLYAVIGCPIAHSRSPELYRDMFKKHGLDADMIRILVEPHELAGICRLAEPLSGFAVTMPHKRAIMPLLDGISDEARSLGAVNIVERRGDELIGHNTDGDGLTDALYALGAELSGRRAAILGRGGAARAAAYALHKRGCEPTFIVREIRDGSSFCEADLAALHTHFDLFINATPLGMDGGEELEASGFLKDMAPSFVMDMVYRRSGETQLIREARRLGIACADGSAMLEKQAERAFRIWTGLEP